MFKIYIVLIVIYGRFSCDDIERIIFFKLNLYFIMRSVKKKKIIKIILLSYVILC